MSTGTETITPTPPTAAADAAPTSPSANWFSSDAPAEAADPTVEPAAQEAPVGAPDKYELALDGVQLDQAMVGKAEPILRELKLSNDAANKLVPIANEMVTSAQDRMMQAMIDAGAQQKKDWLAAYSADPEIGGARRAETQQLAEKGMATLGFKAGHPFRQVLTDTGLGNHPDMIRTFRRLGQLAELDAHTARSGGDDLGSRWYGKGNS